MKGGIALQERPLSAMALGTYRSCPLRYRYRYLDGLFWSRLWGASAAERRAVEKGEAFHLMARRYYAGVDPGGTADPVEQQDLDAWLRRMQDFLPYTFDRTFYPELELRLSRPGLSLVAKFDLLAVEPDGRAFIFDWKTERRLPRRALLEQSPQTLVYRYMLVAAGGAYSPVGRFRPDQVAMIYFNPLHEGRWERLPYSEAQFQADEAELERMAAKLAATPPEQHQPTADLRTCRFCEYRMLCHQERPEPHADDGPERPAGADVATDGQSGLAAEDRPPWDHLPDLA